MEDPSAIPAASIELEAIRTVLFIFIVVVVILVGSAHSLGIIAPGGEWGRGFNGH
jgi:hypothetical protein